MSDDFLSSTWFHAKEMFIGLQSGLAGIFMLQKPTAWTILGCIVTSIFSANVFGPAIASFIRFFDSPYYEAAIGVAGISGTAICYGLCYGIERLVKRWFSVVEEKIK
jgi:hypothetical protein